MICLIHTQTLTLSESVHKQTMYDWNHQPDITEIGMLYRVGEHNLTISALFSIKYNDSFASDAAFASFT